METIEEEKDVQRLSSKHRVSKDREAGINDIDPVYNDDDSVDTFGLLFNEQETSRQMQVQCLTPGQSRLKRSLLCLQH